MRPYGPGARNAGLELIGAAHLTPTSATGRTIADQDVTCRIDQLDPGEQRAYEIHARAEPSAAGKTLTNRGTVTVVDAADPEPANNAAEGSVEVAALPVITPRAPPPLAVVTKCQSRRHFTIRVIERRDRLVRSAQVSIGGRRVAVAHRRSDHRLVADLDLRGKSIIVRTGDGVLERITVKACGVGATTGAACPALALGMDTSYDAGAVMVLGASMVHRPGAGGDGRE